jgi:hypothetical protein
MIYDYSQDPEAMRQKVLAVQAQTGRKTRATERILARIHGFQWRTNLLAEQAAQAKLDKHTQDTNNWSI